jgi:hypothetical protein
VRWNTFSVRQDGSSASTPYLTDPTTQEHMYNDVLIIGFIFEPKDEGIRYMNQNMNVITF